MTARKSAGSSRKKQARKSPARKKKAAKGDPGKEAAKATSVAEQATEDGPAKASPSATAQPAGAQASDVNMGHIFALRPRATTSFPPQALRDAKLALRDDSYATIEEAARALAEKALELTHEGSGLRRGSRNQRY